MVGRRRGVRVTITAFDSAQILCYHMVKQCCLLHYAHEGDTIIRNIFVEGSLSQWLKRALHFTLLRSAT